MGEVGCINCDQKLATKTVGSNPMASDQIVVPPPLSAQDRKSFAYKTIKDRLPEIVVKIIDFFHKYKKELHKFGSGTIENPNERELAEIEEDAKALITQLAVERNAIETNKPTRLLERLDLPPELDYFNDDIDIWNEILEANKSQDGQLPKYFETSWMLAECYVYRKMKDSLLRSRHLKLFDPFIEQKQMAYRASLPQMLIVVNHLIEAERLTLESANCSHPSEMEEFALFIQLALWANKCDLSLSGMSAADVQSQQLLSDIKKSLRSLQDNILCDNISEVWSKVQSIKNKVRLSTEYSANEHTYIDIVADNSGYEIFVDMCLAHFLSLVFCPTSKEASGVRFRFHLKRMPWFVSDTLKPDIDWLLKSMLDSVQNPILVELANKWRSYLASGFWELHDDKYWTLPSDFSDMPIVGKELYASLQQSSLIIFKGDLNYRKLTGDRKWHVLTPFRSALRNFLPAPLVALRTCKADVVVGIEDMNIFAAIDNNRLPKNWMISGDYGLIQYYNPFNI